MCSYASCRATLSYSLKKDAVSLTLFLAFLTTCRPYTILGKSLLGIARSSLFLSVYCASAWLVHDFISSFLGGDNSWCFILYFRAWTCLLFRTFQSANTPLVILGTVCKTLLPYKFSMLSYMILNCFHMTVSNRFGTVYREEEQKN